MERHGWEDTVPDPDPLPPPFSRDSGTPTGRDWVKGEGKGLGSYKFNSENF